MRRLIAMLVGLLGLGSAVARAAVPSRGRRRVGDLLALVVYGVIGVLLVGAVAWYGSAVWSRFAPEDPKVTPLGAMRVVGKDAETTRRLEETLPGLVEAQLEDLKRRWNTTSELMGALGIRPAFDDLGAGGQPTLERQREIADITFKVADVEIGGLLSWLARQEQPEDAVEVTVLFGAGGPVRVFGHRAGARGHAWTVEVEGDLPEVVQTVAAAIWQHEVSRREAAIDVIPGPVFATIVDVRADFAVRMRRHLNSPLPDAERRAEFGRLLGRLGEEPQAHPGWAELQELTALLADQAEDWGVAAAAYVNLLSITSPGDPLHAELRAKLARAEESRRAAEAPRGVAEARRQAARPPDDPRVIALRRLVRHVPGRGSAGVRIGVVGGLPWPELLAGANAEVIGEGDGAAGDDTSRDYQTTLVQAVRLLAPETTFVFAPMQSRGGGSSLEMVQHNLSLLAEQGVDVLLFTWGAQTSDPVLRALAEAAAERTLLVLAAGNAPGTSPSQPLADLALIAAATDLRGAPALFSATADPAVWAPGQEIPLVSPKTGEVVVRSGTAYSAALVAGAGALLREAEPGATAAQIRDALLVGARPAEGRDAPPLLDIAGALARLRRAVGGS
jgi:hypothetical protein